MFTLAVAIALSASLLVQWAAVRVGVHNSAAQSQADTCIPQLQAANTAFKAAAAVDTSHGQDPNKHSLLLTDPNVTNTLRCQQALVQLVGVPPTAADKEAEAAPGDSGDSDPALDNAQQSAGANQASTCSFVPLTPTTPIFKDGIAGSDYRQGFTAKNPFGGNAKASVNMTNAPNASCGAHGGGFNLDISVSGDFTGECHVNAENTRGLTGRSTVTLTASAPYFEPAVAETSSGCPGGLTRGRIDPDGTFHPLSNGDKCVLDPIGALNGNCRASGAVPDHYKDVIGLDQELGYCVLRCSGTTSFAWKSTSVTCINFSALPKAVDKGSTQPVVLNALVGNAKSVSIDQGIGDAGPLDPYNSGQKIGPLPVKTLPDPPGTTYTLTATGVGGDTCRMQATLTVNDTPSTLTITSPAANDIILDGSSVTVSGVITPVPDAAHRTAQISVGGVPAAPATIDAGGNFRTGVHLQNTIGLGDIQLSGPNPVVIFTCPDSPVAQIVATATRADGARNLISVEVPLASGSANASVEVRHAITLDSFRVTWSGSCPGTPDNQTLGGFILTTDLPIPVGVVTCGVLGPTKACSATATITVGTSVGFKTANETWRIPNDITSCN